MTRQTSLYESTAVRSTLGPKVSYKSLGSPPGTTLSPQIIDLLQSIAEQLNLASVGVSTPWAGRVGDLDWEEISDPDTNVQTFIIRDTDILQAQQLMFGQPIPFLVIKTLDPVPRSAFEAALRNSPYELFQTQGVYRQDDPNPIPRIEFHNWVRRRPLDEEGGKSMSQVADELQGDLLFGQQVPVESTSVREKPAIPFQQAFDAQFLIDPFPPVPSPGIPGLPGPVPGIPEIPTPPVSPAPIDPEPEERPPTPSSPAKVPFWGPLLVAGAIAVGTVVVVRGARKR